MEVVSSPPTPPKSRSGSDSELSSPDPPPIFTFPYSGEENDSALLNLEPSARPLNGRLQQAQIDGLFDEVLREQERPEEEKATLRKRDDLDENSPLSRKRSRRAIVASITSSSSLNYDPVSRIPSPDQDIGTISPVPSPTPNVDESGHPKESKPRGKQPFKSNPSPAEAEWSRLKQTNKIKNKAIEELMAMVGLEDVKQQFLAILAKVETCKAQGANLEKERFNIVFQGNPGTGKTTVARLYAKFLFSVGVLSRDKVKETSGAKLAEPGSGKKKVKETIKKLVHAEKQYGKWYGQSSGVLFIDEAYQLTAPHSPREGRQALDVILTEMENRIGRLVVIFVGYNEEMESFFEHNPGLSSRIPYSLQFNDFEDGELWQVLHDNIRTNYNSKMMVEDGLDGLYIRIAVRRLARSRGSRGFGNARAVKNLLALIFQRQAKRLSAEAKKKGCKIEELNCFLLTKEDIIGPDPSNVFKESSAWAKLNALVGLDAVKKSAQVMKSFLEANYQRELEEKRPVEFSLNRVFLGSPGTGKTTVGKLYGQIMADLGLLSNGQVVVKNPTDFIGECLGKSEQKTRAILSTTIGKVLIIDEAYMLDSGSGASGRQADAYRAAVIDTLVAEVQSVPGEDRCILLLGYEEKLKDMFQNVNPGLSRRFAIDNPFRFEDFTLDQLKEILDLKMKQQDVEATQDGLTVAWGILDRTTMRPSYSNAGEVDNCLATAKLNHEAKQQEIYKKTGKRFFDFKLGPEDFDPEYERNVNAGMKCRARLEGLVSNAVIDQLVGYQRTVELVRKLGRNVRKEVPTNFVFKGPPGTGKTTTARQMGTLYYEMGLLSTPEVVEITCTNLIGQYVGQTSPKTRRQLDKAIGKVLFIDEAYRLAQTEALFASEAVNELISLLSNERYEGKMIVILAGYEQDMNQLMTVRPGLSGLFPDEISFENISAEDCLVLLDRELQKRLITTPFLSKKDSDEYTETKRIISALATFPSWCNARQIRVLAKEMSASALKAAYPTDFEADVPAAELSQGQNVTLNFDQARNCLRQMFKVELSRWGSKGQNNAKGGFKARDSYTFDDSILRCQADPSILPMAIDTAEATENTTSMSTNGYTNPAAGRDLPGLPSSVAGLPASVSMHTPHDIVMSQCELPENSATAHRHAHRMGEGTGPGCSGSPETQEQTVEEWRRYEVSTTERKKKAVFKKLRELGACNYGYGWVRVRGGYRCSSGVCFISDARVGID